VRAFTVFYCLLFLPDNRRFLLFFLFFIVFLHLDSTTNTKLQADIAPGTKHQTPNTPHTATAAIGTTKGHGHGALEKKVTVPCVYLISFRGPNQAQDIFSSLFFLVRFWAFLGEGSSKTRQK
jgi:hypothetical protein